MNIYRIKESTKAKARYFSRLSARTGVVWVFSVGVEKIKGGGLVISQSRAVCGMLSKWLNWFKNLKAIREFKQTKAGILKTYSRLVGVSDCFLYIFCNLVNSSFKVSNSLILKRRAKSLFSNSIESIFILLEKENLTIKKPKIIPNKTPSAKLTKMLTLPNLMANSNILPPLFLGNYTIKGGGVLWN